MKLSVIIPVYNEKNTVEEIILRLQKVNLEKELIVVDDGSFDGTTQILRRVESKYYPPIKIIYHRKNSGKGAAIRSALKHVTGKIVIIQDADLEYNPLEYPKLIQPIIEGKTEVVYGVRPRKRIEGAPLLFYLGGKIMTYLTNLIYQTKIEDQATGYKIFETSLLKRLNLKSNRFEFCSEVTAKLFRLGYKIWEVPINVKPRGLKEGKKIRPKDGLVGAWTLIKYRFWNGYHVK
jgi:glycosyltransferase involved in cell wall biosynthesis